MEHMQEISFRRARNEELRFLTKVLGVVREALKDVDLAA